ncbi:hypothetical protein JFL43_21885 [Viridibacillus sp. YIM B01967]|uniref:Aspartyl-phosphate phosphatase Spo0E family protein n=1 Tax=Viridibacillus soli TaxID=2798301 RepID=A0ABS1HDC0_9BACL|nr:hypothetical protein [Viridibacillus soli]MBK3497413.1 hypothetical protein [Viridibacillus soli]
MNKYRKENIEAMQRIAIKNNTRLYGYSLSKTDVTELALRQYINQQEKLLKKYCAKLCK